MPEKENDYMIYETSGIVSIKTLALMTQSNDQSVLNLLKENNVRIMKFGKFKRSWMVRLEDIWL